MAKPGHCYEGEWPHDKYPDILLIAPRERVEQRLTRVIENMIPDFEIYTTTVERMLDPDSKYTTLKIWKEVFNDDGYIKITDIKKESY